MAADSSDSQQTTISCLDSATSKSIDQELMSASYGYSLDVLMELAGLSCAQVIEHFYPLTSDSNNILILCGPGNNGGDGLVAARHLELFGYTVTVVYPKPPKDDLYKRLINILHQHNIPILDTMPLSEELSSYTLIVDAIFGFSFDPKDGIREPYCSIIKQLAELKSSIPIASIDVPSGWDIIEGDILKIGFQPDCLISLTAPKLCARKFQGRYHALGGRFIPKYVGQMNTD